MRRARLFHCQLGAPPEFWPARSRWQDIDLRQADLRGTTADVRFEQIDFRNAKFRGTSFGWSDLVDCQFAGVVHGLTIGSRPIASRPHDWLLSGVDLTAARPRGLQLIGVDLGQVDVRLPADDDHWLVPGWPGFLQRVASAVTTLPEGDLKLCASIWLDYAIKDRGPGQTLGFIAVADVTGLGGPDLRSLLEHAR